VSNSQKSKNHKMSKQIFSKIAKIGEEVRAAEVIKVELSIKDDFEKLYEQAVDKEYFAESQVIDAIETAVAGIQKLESAQTAYIQANALGLKLKAMAAELGVALDAQFTGRFSNTEVRPKDIDKLIQYLKRTKSELNAFL
jgi:hypothetical protein